MAGGIEETANACETGHIETLVMGHNFNTWVVQCYCGRCKQFYDRPFTPEESRKYRRDLTTPMDV